jgi:hypothetical protein
MATDPAVHEGRIVRINQRRKGLGNTPNVRKTERFAMANGPEFTP